MSQENEDSLCTNMNTITRIQGLFFIVIVILVWIQQQNYKFCNLI